MDESSNNRITEERERERTNLQVGRRNNIELEVFGRRVSRCWKMSTRERERGVKEKYGNKKEV
jgi:hypothetical protein